MKKAKEDLVKRWEQDLSPDERKLLQFFILAPGPHSEELLRSCSGWDASLLKPALQHLAKLKLVSPAKRQSNQWSLKAKKSCEAIHDKMDPMAAYRWLVIAGQLKLREGQGLEALVFLHAAQPFGGEDFKKAYLLGLCAQGHFFSSEFEKARACLEKALELSQRCDWEEFIFDFNIFLARLLNHLGSFQDAEQFLRKGLDLPFAHRNPKLHHELKQFLGSCFLEQAKYGAALKVFEECDRFYQEQQDLFSRAMIQISLAQVYSGLGQSQEARDCLKLSQKLMDEGEQKALRPFFDYLQGKIEFMDGRTNAALRSLEKAAHGFEASGDFAGKVEVLLSMSEPLLEYQLLQEAQDIIQFLAEWQQLERFPSLAHSVHLRRLALASFSGKGNQADLQLITQKGFAQGRKEDWLKFWFHMSLAAGRLGREDLRMQFIRQAQALAEDIGAQLESKLQTSFSQRPDVTRIFRLARGREPSEGAKVEAHRQLSQEGPAESATLAPPRPGPAKPNSSS